MGHRVPPRRELTSPGGTPEDGGALQGQQCCCPREGGSSIAHLWVLPTALHCPGMAPAPFLPGEVAAGEWWGSVERKERKKRN